MKKINKIDSLRFNEACDFWTQACVTKLDIIAKGLKPYGLKVYGYSARSDLNFKGVNFIIRGSGFKSKNGKTIVINDNDLKSLKDDNTLKIEGSKYNLCPADCRQCNLCLKPSGNIAFLNHKGSKRHPILPKKIKGKGKYIELIPGLKLTLGNGKLPQSTAIINMGSALNCPSENLGFCKCANDCYAKKAERFYPQSTPFRIRQKQYWLTNDAETILKDIKTALKLQ